MPRGGSNRTKFTVDQMLLMQGPRGHKDLAREFGLGSDMGVRRWRRNNGWVPSRKQAAPAAPLGKSGRVDTPDGSTVTSPPISRAVIEAAGGAEAYLRERWGFPESEWLCVSATGNEWLAQKAGGDTLLLGQVKGSFRKVADLAAVLPAPAAWTGPKYPLRKATSLTLGARRIVVVGDDQAPYHDEALHAATCSLLAAIQPTDIAHIGDLCDYTNISKHKDHAVVKADVDTCTQAGVDILVGMREAAPDARFRILAGNHDIRPLSEMLLRAERMADIHCASLPGEASRRRVIDLAQLWRLDDLGIEYVEDPRGWEHAELDLVPGPRGLAAVHGYLTGSNVAARTLEKVGRSVIMGHTHGPESHSVWNKTIGFEMRAMVIGCQCEVRGEGGKSFPTFAPRDGWLQGGALVTVHADGEWQAERMRWNGESLFVGGARYTP